MGRRMLHAFYIDEKRVAAIYDHWGASYDYTVLAVSERFHDKIVRCSINNDGDFISPYHAIANIVIDIVTESEGKPNGWRDISNEELEKKCGRPLLFDPWTYGYDEGRTNYNIKSSECGKLGDLILLDGWFRERDESIDYEARMEVYYQYFEGKVPDIPRKDLEKLFLEEWEDDDVNALSDEELEEGIYTASFLEYYNERYKPEIKQSTKDYENLDRVIIQLVAPPSKDPDNDSQDIYFSLLTKDKSYAEMIINKIKDSKHMEDVPTKFICSYVKLKLEDDSFPELEIGYEGDEPDFKLVHPF